VNKCEATLKAKEAKLTVQDSSIHQLEQTILSKDKLINLRDNTIHKKEEENAQLISDIGKINELSHESKAIASLVEENKEKGEDNKKLLEDNQKLLEEIKKMQDNQSQKYVNNLTQESEKWQRDTIELTKSNVHLRKENLVLNKKYLALKAKEIHTSDTIQMEKENDNFTGGEVAIGAVLILGGAAILMKKTQSANGLEESLV
jgi:hypothetical protein